MGWIWTLSRKVVFGIFIKLLEEARRSPFPLDNEVVDGLLDWETEHSIFLRECLQTDWLLHSLPFPPGRVLASIALV